MYDFTVCKSMLLTVNKGFFVINLTLTFEASTQHSP